MKLVRSLSLTDSTSLMFSSMVGSGIFFTTGFIINKVENPWVVLLCWFLGGLLALTGALTYAKPATLFPFSGGDYIYLKEAYSPMIAFMSGWTALTINFSASISALGITFSKHLFYIVPVDEVSFLERSFLGLTFNVGPGQIIGVAIILIFTIISYTGMSTAVKVQNVLTFLKITGLVIFVTAGFMFGNTNMQLLTSYSPFPDVWNINKILIGIIPVTFSYLGWNMVTYVAEEVKNPERNIWLSILIACIMVIALYLSINFLFLVSAPPEQLKNQEGIGVISAINLFGKGSTALVSAFICWVLLGSLSATIIGGSRVYYAMAKDGLFFPSLAKIHPFYKSPHNALFFQAGYASLFMFVKELESLLYLITCSILILSSLTAMTPFIFAKRGLKSKFRIPGYPFTPVIYVFFNIVIMIMLYYDRPVEGLWGIGITLSSIPIYYFFKKRFRKA